MKATITPQDAGSTVSVSYTEACDANMEVQNQVQPVSFIYEQLYGISCPFFIPEHSPYGIPVL